MHQTRSNHPPHRRNHDDEDEPVPQPVEPDEGPAPGAIPDDPEQ